MKIFNTEILNAAINSVFKSKSNFLYERKEMINLIIKDDNDFYSEIKNRRKEKFSAIVVDFKINHTDAVEKLRKLNEAYDKEKKSLVNIKGKDLLQEYNEKYSTPLVSKGFKNKAILYFDPISSSESVTYEKTYENTLFIISFIPDENKEFKNIDISVRMDKNVLNSSISLARENKKMCLTDLYIPHKNIFLESNARNEFANMFLSSLGEEDILTLDSKEKEDFFSMIFDFKLNLKDDPLYETFKIGMSEFINIVKNEVKIKNHNQLKGV